MWFLFYDQTPSGITTHSFSQGTENVLERPQGLGQPACHSPSFLAHQYAFLLQELGQVGQTAASKLTLTLVMEPSGICQYVPKGTV